MKIPTDIQWFKTRIKGEEGKEIGAGCAAPSCSESSDRKLKPCVTCAGTGIIRSMPSDLGRKTKRRFVVESECYVCGGNGLRSGHGK